MSSLNALKNSKILEELHGNADLQPSSTTLRRHKTNEVLKSLEDPSKVNEAIKRLRPETLEVQCTKNKLLTQSQVENYKPIDLHDIQEHTQQDIKLNVISPRKCAPKSPKFDVQKSLEASAYEQQYTFEQQINKKVLNDDEVLQSLLDEIKQRKNAANSLIASAEVKPVQNMESIQELDLQKSEEPEETTTIQKVFQHQKQEKHVPQHKKDEDAINQIVKLQQTKKANAQLETKTEKTTQKVDLKRNNEQSGTKKLNPNLKSKSKPKAKQQDGQQYIYEFLDNVAGEEKIIAITKVATGQRVYRKVPRFQYEELMGKQKGQSK